MIHFGDESETWAMRRCFRDQGGLFSYIMPEAQVMPTKIVGDGVSDGSIQSEISYGTAQANAADKRAARQTEKNFQMNSLKFVFDDKVLKILSRLRRYFSLNGNPLAARAIAAITHILDTKAVLFEQERPLSAISLPPCHQQPGAPRRSLASRLARCAMIPTSFEDVPGYLKAMIAAAKGLSTEDREALALDVEGAQSTLMALAPRHHQAILVQSAADLVAWYIRKGEWLDTTLRRDVEMAIYRVRFEK
jgi:hypothetical protein